MRSVLGKSSELTVDIDGRSRKGFYKYGTIRNFSPVRGV